MSKRDKDKNETAEAWAPPEFTEGELAKAKQCFVRGQELASKKNYDYAIQMYISGLEHWPEAVEEGHMPCRAAALFRGKAKVGFGDQMKYKTSGKDARKAMLNAEVLLAKDPQNIGYMEALFKNAAKAGYHKTVMWIGEIFMDAVVKEAKTNLGRLQTLREVYEEVAEREQEINPNVAIMALERAVEALRILHQIKPGDLEISTDHRDVAGKLTILRGKYSSAESFTDSVRDTDTQRELHDKDRMVTSDDRLGEMIDMAKRRYKENPTHKPTINELVTLLVRREEEKYENTAIKVLQKAYEETKDYDHKRRADEVRIKQLRRKERQETDRDAKLEATKTLLRFELGVYKERAEKYPTDMRVRYLYGMTLFKAGRYDDAIPVLQEARSDPKTRVQCSIYLGRSFYRKGYHSQAADTFLDAIKSHEIPDDDLGKEAHYWLARSQEAEEHIDEALKTYGQIIQWDYNFRDVRKRIDDLRAQK